MTPSAVHHGQAPALHAARGLVLDAAYECCRPERFLRRPPVPPELPTATWINKPDTKEVAHRNQPRGVSSGLTGSAGRSTRPVTSGPSSGELADGPSPNGDARRSGREPVLLARRPLTR